MNSNNYLMHWKYISKKKVNGKWRYYYDYNTPNQKPAGNPKGYTKLEDLLGKDERDIYAESIRAYNKALDNMENNPSGTRAELQRLFDEADRAGDNVTAARKVFLKTPMGKLDQMGDVVEKGRNKVADVLVKLSDKIRTDGDYLDKLARRD